MIFSNILSSLPLECIPRGGLFERVITKNGFSHVVPSWFLRILPFTKKIVLHTSVNRFLILQNGFIVVSQLAGLQVLPQHLPSFVQGYLFFTVLYRVLVVVYAYVFSCVYSDTLRFLFCVWSEYESQKKKQSL